ncbi:MAG TPA: lipocalin-like domain-containing protein [Xanthobacteraceae bacterium]|nr:lipocalin-like domain-containing protein [Xanthobacteraceae bacterium]
MSGSADDKARARLIGTWTLVAAVREEVPSGQSTHFLGAQPRGYLTYSPEGRMLALITHADRKAPAAARASAAEAEALFRSMVSYGGTFTVAGDVVTHHVDISWNQSFTGGDQRRQFVLDGDRLILSTPQSPDPVDGKPSVRRMTWQRVGRPQV